MPSDASSAPTPADSDQDVSPWVAVLEAAQAHALAHPGSMRTLIADETAQPAPAGDKTYGHTASRPAAEISEEVTVLPFDRSRCPHGCDDLLYIPVVSTSVQAAHTGQ